MVGSNPSNHRTSEFNPSVSEGHHNFTDTRGERFTSHKVIIGDSRTVEPIDNESVDLVVTSPPYPMIEMWDDVFSAMNPDIGRAIEEGDGDLSFELMHRELDKVWKQSYRILRNGGIACINIGDATRTVGGMFRLFPNHVRIVSAAMKIGFNVLPEIIWRKESNKPNKFMGSGMLPAGAYVTQEHEYILILRKGNMRKFHTVQERENRLRSAIFWEERNAWFSDIWRDLKGEKQALDGSEMRKRSAAFPLDLAYRLINMYSVRMDTVFDPFLGTGTTVIASILSGRNSIGMENDAGFYGIIEKRIMESKKLSDDYVSKRKMGHLAFVDNRTLQGKEIKHANSHYGFPVVTRQETSIILPEILRIMKTEEGRFSIEYSQ